MGIHERETPWLRRIEELIHVLEGSSIGELELTEAGTEIIIRRQPGMVLVAATSLPGLLPMQPVAPGQVGIPVVPGAGGRAAREDRSDRSVAIVSPLTGVYYAAPSPTSPPFVSVGDVVQVGQVVALVEAMKVFNEIQAEVSGRVVALVANNGNVVQKGDALIRVEST